MKSRKPTPRDRQLPSLTDVAKRRGQTVAELLADAQAVTPALVAAVADSLGCSEPTLAELEASPGYSAGDAAPVPTAAGTDDEISELSPVLDAAAPAARKARKSTKEE